MNTNNLLTTEEETQLLTTLKTRFEKNMHRHINYIWEEVYSKLHKNKEKLITLLHMEKTGGEPDVVGDDPNAKEYFYYDCSAESPSGRRSLCYDPAALESRKEHKPKDSATARAGSMGIELLTEEEYIYLQKFGEFDLKSSSWIKTPSDVRKLGGAIFADRRYDRIFIYHNGAESYYAARGFRGLLKI